jgi:hypothetical protein
MDYLVIFEDEIVFTGTKKECDAYAENWGGKVIKK